MYAVDLKFFGCKMRPFRLYLIQILLEDWRGMKSLNCTMPIPSLGWNLNSCLCLPVSDSWRAMHVVHSLSFCPSMLHAFLRFLMGLSWKHSSKQECIHLTKTFKTWRSVWSTYANHRYLWMLMPITARIALYRSVLLRAANYMKLVCAFPILCHKHLQY